MEPVRIELTTGKVQTFLAALGTCDPMNFGGRGWLCPSDTRIFNPVLYYLSYPSERWWHSVFRPRPDLLASNVPTLKTWCVP